MKKALGILSVLVLITVMLVSCNAEQKVNDTVEVSFNVSSSRALTVTNEGFTSVYSEDLTWYYHGEKKTDKEFKTGQSASMDKTSTDYWTRISKGNELAGKQVTFSQGQWYFEVKAIKNDGTQMYYGKTNGNVLLTKEQRTISISVSPFVSGVKGTLVLNGVYIEPADGNPSNVAPNKLLINGVPKNISISEGATSLSYTEQVEPGTYTVEVQRVGKDTGVILASASKTVVVYSGLTTTISGSVEEDTTTGTFVPQPIKPEGTETVTVPETGDAVVVFSNVTPSMEADKSTTVTIPSAVVSSATSAVTLDIVVKDYRSVADYSFNVETGKGVAASISLTMKDGDTVKTNFGSNKVTVETYIGTGLSGVTVKYNGTGTTGNLDPDSADTNYEPDTGKLTFKTTHFSEFYVEADAQAKIDNVGYCLLQTAFNVAENNSTISLLADVETPKTSYYVENKNLTLNLNGHELSGSGYDGTLCVKSNATLTINGDGEVIGNDDNNYGMAIWAVGENAKVIINGGTYSNTLTHDDHQMDLIYASRGGNVVINGGVFNCTTPAWTLNVRDDDYASGASNITVCGGEFHGFNPANCRAEGVGTSFIVDWYSSKNSGSGAEAIYEVGSAVDDEEITISSVEGLVEFARLVNESGKLFNNQTIKLVRDIDLKNEEWTPIGQKAGNKFAGVFDGNNKTISGLSITENNIAVTNALFDNYVGLFGAIDGGTVKNLTISGSVKGKNAAGIVARMESGTIENCKSYVTVVGNNNDGKAGGIVCLTNTGNCTIKNCINNGSVKGVTDNGVGGIAAYVNANTTISGCTNNAEIGSNTDKYSGGIAGYVTSKTDNILIDDNCTNTGSVTAYQDAGGIVGIITGLANITNCSNSGAINAGQNGNGGGIAGSTHQSNITGCRNTASVHGKYAGGVIGVDGASTITNCSGGTADITSPAHTITFTDNNFTLSVAQNESSGRIIGAHMGAGPDKYTVIKLDNTNGDSKAIPTVGICGNTTTMPILKISSGTFYGNPLAGNGSTIILESGATWGERAAGTYTRGGLDESKRIAKWTKIK